MKYGICPVCDGSKRMPYVGEERWKSVIAGYNKETNSLPCNNCGGQTMFGSPSGKVPLRKDGTPCNHEYESKTIGRCLTRYSCKHCSSSHDIDSGD